MRQSNVVMLAFSAFLGKICTKGFVPMADIFSCVVKSISKISGTTLFHMGVAIIQLP